MSVGLKATNINRCVAAQRLSCAPIPRKLPACGLVACKRLAYKISHAGNGIQDRALKIALKMKIALKVLPRGQRGMHAAMQGGVNT